MICAAVMKHFWANSQVRYVCQHCKIPPFHSYRSSVDWITLPASQPAVLGLRGVKPSEPSTLPSMLSPTLIPNTYTSTPCSSAVCPQCLQVTGWGANWHHAKKCHLVRSLVPRWAPWQHWADLGACCLTSGPVGAMQRGLAGAGTGLGLAQATVCSL